MKPYVPLGILYISAYLKQFGFDVMVYDSTFKSFEDQKKVLGEIQPDVVGIYCNLMTKLNVLPLIKFIKSTPKLIKTKIILGGPEPPFNSKKFLDYGADIIVAGEGEVTMRELCAELSKSKSDLSGINGIIYKNNSGNEILNPQREKIKDIDMLPFPDRESIEMNKYLNTWNEAHGYSSVSISTMRGCPYTCKWCSHSVYGVSYRRKSPEKTIEEIQYIIEKYSPDRFWFVDDVFTVSYKWLFRLHQLIKEKNIDMRFECISRSDRLNEEVIHTLKSMGCNRLWIGAESGSQKVIDLMDRRVDVIQTRDMIRLTRKAGIEAGTFIMLGYPGEKKEDIYETAEHLRKSNPDIFLTTVAYPIKGTPFYSEVESRLIMNKSWENGTDRDLNFEGRYSKRFYKYANRFLVNEVNFYKMKNNIEKNYFKLGGTFIKAKTSSLMMKILN